MINTIYLYVYFQIRELNEMDDFDYITQCHELLIENVTVNYNNSTSINSCNSTYTNHGEAYLERE